MSSCTPGYLFDCLDLVRKRLSGVRGIGVFLDLDGTLAWITQTPKMTRLAPETRGALVALAADPSFHVAIVSGRAIEDLRSVVKVSGITYAGNHGLEISGPAVKFTHTEAKRSSDLMREIARRLEKKLQFVQGALVEFKTLTIAVHFRLVATDDMRALRLAVADAIKPVADRVNVAEGRCVLDIKPAIQWNKGDAVRWLVERFGCDTSSTIYVGDDKTDEDAFAALPHSITVNVGLPHGVTCARYFLRSPDGVLVFLEYLPEVARTTVPSPVLARAAIAHQEGGLESVD